MHPISCYLYLITEYRQRTSYWHSTTLGSAIFKNSRTNANTRSPNFLFSLGMKEVGSAACWPLFSVLQNKDTYNTEEGRDRARRAKGLIRNVDQWPAGCPINLARKLPWGQNGRRGSPWRPSKRKTYDRQTHHYSDYDIDTCGHADNWSSGGGWSPYVLWGMSSAR